MPEHHLQRDILHLLVTSESARFSELKPKDIDGNVFTYHIQQLIKQKLVQKSTDGTYSLTARGKATGINILLTPTELLEQAHSVLFMAVRNENGDWLLRRRKAHPVFGKAGFIHGEPVLGESVTTTAAKVVQAKTGLNAEFIVRGSGYIRIFQSDAMESFTHFTLLETRNPSGQLINGSVTGENIWLRTPDFRADDMIPSMPDLVEALAEPGIFFRELSYQL